MRKFAAVLYVRNRGTLGKFYPWACVVSSDSKNNAHVKAIEEAHTNYMEVYCVYSVLDVPDSVG